MAFKYYKWLTNQDGPQHALLYNARMVKFLADSKVEIHHLELEISVRNEYDDEEMPTRDYDGKGSFLIDEKDDEKFIEYLKLNYNVINPEDPEILYILLYDDTKSEDDELCKAIESQNEH